MKKDKTVDLHVSSIFFPDTTSSMRLEHTRADFEKNGRMRLRFGKRHYFCYEGNVVGNRTLFVNVFKERNFEISDAKYDKKELEQLIKKHRLK